ncbi:MAG: PAS domain S-box protein [Dehalococcoidales bacterium]|nr:PAS domain S-box protein [Dehalococcoidales bacterium]
MQFDFPWYSSVYLIGSALTLVLAVVIRTRQFAPGVIPFTLLLFSMTIWTLTSALEAGAVDISAKIIFSKAEYVALVSSGVLSLTFILEFTRSTWSKRRRNLILLWIVPVLSLAVVWTNELHGQVWPSIYLVRDITGVISVWEHGPAFWPILIYQYILYAIGIFILVRFLMQSRGMYRRHIIWLLAGSMIPIIGSIVYVSGGSPVKGFDLTPVSICLMGVIYAVTILRFKFMDILPTATESFLEKLPDGFLLLDAEGLIVSLNPATEKIIGQDIHILKGCKLASIWPELDEAAFSSRQEKYFELAREQTGGKTYLNVSVESFTDGYGTLTGKLIILRNISEMKLIQRQLEDEISKRSQFTRSVVHELRNPLTAIISSSSLLEDRSASSEAIRLALARNIGRASIDLEKRVNELFELARGEMGLLDIKPDMVNMNGLIYEVVSEMEPVTAEKGIKLVCQTGEADAVVMGDNIRLRQVLFNLLSNSLKFTDRGQITIRSLRYDDNQLLIQVEDTGKGIDDAMLKNLFDPYQRNKVQKTSSVGLGIGLALSKYYIELHKGNMWAESVQGKGTTISFTLPYAQQDTLAHQQSSV